MKRLMVVMSCAVLLMGCGSLGLNTDDHAKSDETPTPTIDVITYTVGGTVDGLDAGENLILQNNGADDLIVNSDSEFVFSTAIADDGIYEVTVIEKPARKTCTVSRGTGNVPGANVADVRIVCSIDAYFIGGTLSGLVEGEHVVLQNNKGYDLTITSDRDFVFSTGVANGGDYEVTVFEKPATKTCSVSYGKGTVKGADVSNVKVVCSTDTYSVGGAVSGLAAGEQVVLQNNNGYDLTVIADREFSFPTKVADGGDYNIIVLRSPDHNTCVVNEGTGTVLGADVTGARIVCSVNTFTVSGNVSGLDAGEQVVLQNNGGDDLTMNANDAFTFATMIAYNSPYEVTALTSPAHKTCTVGNGSGLMPDANITNVSIICSINAYAVGGNVSGLGAGDTLVLKNNGADNLTVGADGAFVFPIKVADGGNYAVTVFTNPTNKLCTPSSNIGLISGANITNVKITCVNTYSISGSISGLGVGSTVVLQNNFAEQLTLTSDGTFIFTTRAVDGAAYSVLVKSLTSSTRKVCTPSNNTGTLAGADVTNVSFVCRTWTETKPAGELDKAWNTVASDEDGSNLIAAVNGGRLYTSSDSGATWTERRPNDENVDKKWYTVASDSTGTNLVAGAYTGRLYTSSNGGVTWTERRPDGDKNKNWMTVASDSTGTNLIAGVWMGRLYTSSNGGSTWTERQPLGVNADKKWRAIASDSSGSHLVAGVTSGRLYASSNGGVSWTELKPAGDVDKEWRAVSSDADGSNLIAASMKGRIYVSSDFGANWNVTNPFGDVDKNWQTVASDGDGSCLIAAGTPTTTPGQNQGVGRLFMSLDGGSTWLENQPTAGGDVIRAWNSSDSDSDCSHVIVAPGSILVGETLVSGARLYLGEILP